MELNLDNFITKTWILESVLVLGLILRSLDCHSTKDLCSVGGIFPALVPLSIGLGRNQLEWHRLGYYFVVCRKACNFSVLRTYLTPCTGN